VLWQVLEALSAIPHAQWLQHAPPFWTLLPAITAVALLLAPRGCPCRWLGIVLLLPLVFITPQRPGPGEYQITLLDVGQGLSAVIETHRHVLLYDAGPRYSANFDSGEAVVVPFLRHRRVDSLDRVIISHGDNDHIGGLGADLRTLPVDEILTSATDKITHHRTSACRSGQEWVWDEVKFKILHPVPDWRASRNNLSCVLRVSNQGGSLLLGADIEKRAERRLLRHARKQLSSDIMLIPHHGSPSSSNSEFIEAVGPQLALLTSGYRNRYGFPFQDVINRYRDRGIKILHTLELGAITISVTPSDGIQIQPGYRQRNLRYWRSVP